MSQYPDFNSAFTILNNFIDNFDTIRSFDLFNMIDCNANIIFITASMPGRDPVGTVNTHLITTTQIDDLTTKITNFNTAKGRTLMRVSTYSVGGCDINAQLLQSLACSNNGFYYSAALSTDLISKSNIYWHLYYPQLTSNTPLISSTRYIHYSTYPNKRLTACKPIDDNGMVYCHDTSLLFNTDDIEDLTDWTMADAYIRSQNATCNTVTYTTAELTSARGTYSDSDCTSALSATLTSCPLCSDSGSG